VTDSWLGLAPPWHLLRLGRGVCVRKTFLSTRLWPQHPHHTHGVICGRAWEAPRVMTCTCSWWQLDVCSPLPAGPTGSLFLCSFP
jgi:hypothetical protein